MFWTLGVSLALHVIFVASVVRLPAAHAASLQTPEPSSIEIRPLTVRTPVPTPPTPPPRVTPRPAPSTIPPRVSTSPRRPHPARFRPHLVQVARGPSPREAAPPGRADGSPGGDPTGMPGPSASVGAGAVPASAVPSALSSPTPSPTAKPSCTTPDLPAHAIDVVSPAMPDTAEERQETGTVRVLVALDTAGSVGATSIETSSGFPDLDQAALRAAQQSRFAAEVHDCHATAGTYLFVARFEE